MAWNRETPPIAEGEDELQLKLEYARIVARNERERYTAGYKIFPGPDNYGRALQSQAWYYDPIVQDEISRLRDNEDEDAKPSVENVKGEVLQRARSATDDKDAAALYKLYLEAEGVVSRGTNINVKQDNRTINVLRVPAQVRTADEREDFNRRFKEQQITLIADARSNRPKQAA